jgi:hypothetical protein
MTMPGFTAEASFSSQMKSYSTVRNDRNSATVQGVAPQLGRLGIGFCMAGCGADDWSCLFDCLRGNGEDGVGGGFVPPPMLCGPCRRGRQRCVVPGVGGAWVPCDGENGHP